MRKKKTKKKSVLEKAVTETITRRYVCEGNCEWNWKCADGGVAMVTNPLPRKENTSIPVTDVLQPPFYTSSWRTNKRTNTNITVYSINLETKRLWDIYGIFCWRIV